MKKYVKSLLAGILAFAVLVTAIPVQTVSAKPASMSKKDFIYTLGGEKMYLTDMDDVDGRVSVLTNKDLKTNRGIKVGSKMSAVKSKYGKISSKKFDTKESFNKYIKQYAFQYGANTSGWKKYLEYSYKKNTKDDRRLRFYLDKNDKVTAIVYIYKHSKFKLSGKTVGIGFSFQAPSGKKITTKKVGGQTVQVLPKNTKIKYKTSKVPEFGLLADIIQVDTKGRDCASAMIPLNLNNASYKSGTKLTNVMNNAMLYKYDPATGNYKGSVDLKKLGKYNYFKFVIYDINAKGGYDTPAIYYFRL